MLFYIDNEVLWDAPNHYGEWDSIVEQTGSTIDQTSGSAFPERGSVGLDVQTVASKAAYASRHLNYSVPAGGSVFLGFWMKLISAPPASLAQLVFAGLRTASPTYFGYGYVYYNNKLRLAVYDDDGNPQGDFFDDAMTLGRWHWVVLEVRRESADGNNDGYAKGYMDGVLMATVSNVDNYNRFADFDYIWLGSPAAGLSREGTQYYLDEVKISTNYPEPYVPAPADEYPSSRRTCVLYRTGSADSVEFADYCVSQLGIPRANLIPLPNAPANESLADYATFSNEVEDSIDGYFSLNPTVAANCTCFLVGYGVPGYFTNASVKHSATSRLMNYGTVFSSQIENPLYNPSTVSRLTATALGGKYLASRIDADTLAGAKAIIDAASTVVAISVLPDTNKLYSDDANYLASAACQQLRILTAALDTYADDAFVWGDTSTPGFGDADSRICFTDDSADSASGLRTGSAACFSALSNSYASALGFAETAGELNAESFFEMLRIGGTLAEAFAVATRYLDHTAVAAGDPLMTVAFEAGGYNFYRWTGSPDAIDYETPVGFAPLGSGTVDLTALGHEASVDYYYGIRTVSSAGVEEQNTHQHVHVKTDAQGNLLPANLPPPLDVTAETQPDCAVVLGFSYVASCEDEVATAFEVFSDDGSGTLNLETPVSTVSGFKPGQEDFELLLMPITLPCKYAVRARKDELIGPLSKITTAIAASQPTPPVRI